MLNNLFILGKFGQPLLVLFVILFSTCWCTKFNTICCFFLNFNYFWSSSKWIISYTDCRRLPGLTRFQWNFLNIKFQHAEEEQAQTTESARKKIPDTSNSKNLTRVFANTLLNWSELSIVPVWESLCAFIFRVLDSSKRLLHFHHKRIHVLEHVNKRGRVFVYIGTFLYF